MPNKLTAPEPGLYDWLHNNRKLSATLSALRYCFFAVCNHDLVGLSILRYEITVWDSVCFKITVGIRFFCNSTRQLSPARSVCVFAASGRLSICVSVHLCVCPSVRPSACALCAGYLKRLSMDLHQILCVGSECAKEEAIHFFMPASRKGAWQWP